MMLVAAVVPKMATIPSAPTMAPGWEVEIALGDMRDADALARACADQEVALHLAAVLPLISDQQPEMARAVNVGGTQTLVEALQALPQPPKLVYASTVAVFGDTQAQQPPRRVSNSLHPMDPYSQYKAECEALQAASGLTYTVLRMSAIPRYDEGFDELRFRAMFAIPPADRMECIHQCLGQDADRLRRAELPDDDGRLLSRLSGCGGHRDVRPKVLWRGTPPPGLVRYIGEPRAAPLPAAQLRRLHA
jgi:hypothetical protein